MLKRWKPVESIDALGGDGVIAGELSGDPEVPDGLLTVNGVPTSREIEVRERKTRRVVSVRRSNTDGTYRFPGLNPALQYDVIARDFAGDYEDVIAGAVRPHTPDLLVPVVAGDKMAAFVDPFGPNVVSLLHFDGPDGSATFTDETGKAWTPYGDAQIDATQYKFGGGSLLLDGTGDYLSTPNHSDFDLSTGAFTVEAWIRLNTTSGIRSICSHRLSGGTAGWVFWFRGDISANIGFVFNTSGPIWVDLNGGSSLSTGQWYHVAVTFDGTTLRLFLNGVVDGSTTSFSGTRAPSTTEALIGRDRPGNTSRDFNGNIDDLRITKGVARYTANFTPPTAPFEL